jgi:hypothetical protein
MPHGTAASLDRTHEDERGQPSRQMPTRAPAPAAPRRDNARDDEDEEDTLRIEAREKQRLVASAFAFEAARERPAETPRPVTVAARPRWLVIGAPGPPPRLRAIPRLAVSPHAIISRDAVPASFPRVPSALVMPVAGLPTPASPLFVAPRRSRVNRYLSRQVARATRACRDFRAFRVVRMVRWGDGTLTIQLPRGGRQGWVVAGICAVALTLLTVAACVAKRG